jgi:hypothetical protein
MAAVIVALGALFTHCIIEKRKSHKAAKQSAFDSKRMKTEDPDFYLHRSSSSVYSQTTLHEALDPNLSMSAYGQPKHEDVAARSAMTKDEY